MRELVFCMLMVLLTPAELSRAPQLSSAGMTVLKTVYGSSCNMGRTLATGQHHLKRFVKGLCDGTHACSGVLEQTVINKLNINITNCRGDFHAVAVCANGEIRSISIDARAVGTEFTLNCTGREIPVTKQHPDWMGELMPSRANNTIKQLKLAGSHHSGTHTFSGFLASLAKCQQIRVGQQLIAGVRYLDYRIGKVTDEPGPRIVHGIVDGHHFMGDLLEIWAFTQLHPNEFFILDLQNTVSLSRRMQRQLKTWLKILFKKVAIKSGSVYLASYTLGSVWSSGRRLLILHDRPRSNLVWTRRVLHSRWPNVCTGETLSDHALTEQSALVHRRDKLVTMQWLITVKITCLTSLYERSMAIKDSLLEWIRTHGCPFTIVLTDFTVQPFNETNIVELLIEANRQTHK